MPNWSSNTIALKGNKEQVLNFLNSALETKSDDINDAFSKVFDNPENNITLGTFRPMPKTFTEFDTTNDMSKTFVEDYLKGERIFATDCVPDYVKELKEQGCTDEDEIRKAQERYKYDYEAAKAYQEKKYGAVGWYDYNRNVRFGCKWDADMVSVEMSTDKTFGDNGTFIITFNCDTPWYFPYLWCGYIQEQFGLDVYICAFEESGEYYFYGMFNGNEIVDETTMEEPEHREEEEEWEEYYDELEDAKENFLSEFYDYIWKD